MRPRQKKPKRYMLKVTSNLILLVFMQPTSLPGRMDELFREQVRDYSPTGTADFRRDCATVFDQWTGRNIIFERIDPRFAGKPIVLKTT